MEGCKVEKLKKSRTIAQNGLASLADFVGAQQFSQNVEGLGARGSGLGARGSGLGARLGSAARGSARRLGGFEKIENNPTSTNQKNM